MTQRSRDHAIMVFMIAWYRDHPAIMWSYDHGPGDLVIS